MDQLQQLRDDIKDLDTQALVGYIQDLFGNEVTLASSLGAEDQVLTHLCLEANPKSKIFVLDTGRFHQETYSVIAKSMDKYTFNYDVYFPKHEEVQKLVENKGPNSFYESIEHRKECCGIRKVEPLSRALGGKKAWITGLRKAQSSTRTDIERVEWDDSHGLYKFNPLADWSEEDVWHFIKENKVPYNSLHDKGFASIGCAPCTRAINKGEDLRAGRWWWENPDQKECGLHIKTS